VVDAVAAEDDPRAAAILEEAGAHLGTLVLDMASQTHFDTMPTPLVLSGGVFHSTRVIAAIERSLAKASHLFSVYPVVLDPIVGLIQLLQRDTTIRTS
jgi:N-acetylglucosamine kinase-like BadF-type ATPase